MPVIFKKVIARPGVVIPKNPLGQREVKVLTEADMREIVRTGNEMLADKLLISAPYGHSDGEGTIPLPLTQDPNKPEVLLDSKRKDAKGNPLTADWTKAHNAGFWRKFEIDPETGYAVGYLEAEGDEQDQNTHAGRVGKTFCQTSPFLLRNWVDGEGRLRPHAPLHICVTNKGVQSAQENFKVLSPQEISKQGLTHPELAIAMSLDDESYQGALSLADTEVTVVKGVGLTPSVVQSINKLLKEKLAVTLPTDTDVDNFPDRLLTILTNMEERKGEEDSLTKLPSGSEVLQTPTIMSTETAGGAPGNPDDLVMLNKRAQGLLAQTNLTVRSRLSERLTAAKQVGKVGAKKAAYMEEKIKGFALSLDDLQEDGTWPTTSLELDMEDIEAQDSLTNVLTDPAKPPAGSEIPGETDDMGESKAKNIASDEQVKEVLDAVLC